MRSDSSYVVAVIFARTPRVAVFLALVVAASLSACAPAPQPSPTPTPAFASEAEAFAAAEAVYRAYNEAGNADGNTTDFLTSTALQNELETTRYLSENSLTLEGASIVQSFAGTAADLDSSTPAVDARVCLDVSQAKVLDSSNADVTPADRVEQLTLDVNFVWTKNGLLIAASEIAEQPSC